jgi:hypothetical protein
MSGSISAWAITPSERYPLAIECDFREAPCSRTASIARWTTGVFRRQDGRERGRLFSIFPRLYHATGLGGASPREAPRVGDVHEELQSLEPIIHVI